VRIHHDPARNRLRLRLRRGLAIGLPLAATAAIDVGANGRLLGVELAVDPVLAAPFAVSTTQAEAEADPSAPQYDAAAGTLYVPLSENAAAAHDPHARTALAEVALAVDRAGALLAIDLPRRGHGYEISYPSGNR
jgi:hypothetical protein